MKSQRPHHKLEVWREGIALVSTIYEITNSFPPDERFGLTSQIRRAAISIPSNLAEGSARHSRKELRNFVSIARGSLAELETQILIAADLGYCDISEKLDEDINCLYAKPNKLHSSLKA